MEYLTQLIIILSFIWLGYESDWLTIRLLVGVDAKPIQQEYETWAELEKQVRRIPDRYLPFWFKFPDNMQPLCGTDWLENSMHVIPQTRIELITGGVKYKMTIKKDSILKDVMRVNKLTKKQKLAYA